MKTGACTLCISTYNWPAALQLCLDSVLRQSLLPAEVIVGDDGSRPDTATLISQYQRRFPVPLLHLWQPDDGFRLAQIRNRSFAQSTQPYIIQIDGDLILHPRFIASHLHFARQNAFVCGSRAMLSLAMSQILLSGQLSSHTLNMFSPSLKKRYNAVSSRLLAATNYWLQRGHGQYRYVIGANMAFWRADLLKVNGYNEAFTGWGKEDNELAIRLCNSGVKLRFLKFAALAYHIYHKTASDGSLAENERLLAQTVANKITFAKQGLDSYL